MKNILTRILCHHFKDEQAHCIGIPLFNKKIYFCSRCLGLYPFSIIGLVLSLKYNIRLSGIMENNIIHFLFLPAFLDWALSGLKIIKSNNIIRFFTGFIASFALSRVWFLLIRRDYPDILLKNLLIYITAVIIILAIIYKKRSLV